MLRDIKWKKTSRLVWIDKNGYPIEKFINKPFKSFCRLLCQIMRGNAKLVLIFSRKEI
jgi:hypothetical protein